MEMEISAPAIFPKEWNKGLPHVMCVYAFKENISIRNSFEQERIPRRGFFSHVFMRQTLKQNWEWRLKMWGKDSEEQLCLSMYMTKCVWQQDHHSPFSLPLLASANSGCISWGKFLFLFIIQIAWENTHLIFFSYYRDTCFHDLHLWGKDNDFPAFLGESYSRCGVSLCSWSLYSNCCIIVHNSSWGHGLFFFHLFYFLYSSLNEQNLGPWSIFKRKKRLFWFPFLREFWQYNHSTGYFTAFII